MFRTPHLMIYIGEQALLNWTNWKKKARILCFEDGNNFSDFKFVRDDAFSQR